MLLTTERHWSCPNCDLREITRTVDHHTRFHACRGLRGLTAPMVEDGTRCKVEALEREDYVNRELVTCDGEGRPVMSVQVTRDDGTDLAVFAPCATN